MNPHILIIEDDPDIAESVRYNLARDGAFTVSVAPTGEEGLKAVFGLDRASNNCTSARDDAPPDLIVLDINLPGMNGFDLCHRLRAEKLTRLIPIIILTARTDENDKVRGLELGADDYLTKPFSMREMIARIRAALRRVGHDSIAPSLYEDGRLRIDYVSFRVTCQGAPIKLTRKEFGLLAILSHNKGRVVSRQEVIDRVWGAGNYGDARTARTLDAHVCVLRKKLGACGACIETVIGIGYRFRGCVVATA